MGEINGFLNVFIPYFYILNAILSRKTEAYLYIIEVLVQYIIVFVLNTVLNLPECIGQEIFGYFFKPVMV